MDIYAYLSITVFLIFSSKSSTAHGEAPSVQALPTDWVIYDELIQGDRATIRCCSLVTPITVAIFGGCARLPGSALQMAKIGIVFLMIGHVFLVILHWWLLDKL